jgi:hypothetical protein
MSRKNRYRRRQVWFLETVIPLSLLRQSIWTCPCLSVIQYSKNDVPATGSVSVIFIDRPRRNWFVSVVQYAACQVSRATEFCTVASKTFGCSVWNLLHVILLEGRIVRWIQILDLVRIRVGGQRFFSSLKRPDRLWAPRGLPFRGYRGSPNPRV